VLTSGDLQTLTVGLAIWSAQSVAPLNAEPAYTIVITASLLSIIPLVVAFFMLQRYWRAGLAAGAVR